MRLVIKLYAKQLKCHIIILDFFLPKNFSQPTEMSETLVTLKAKKKQRYAEASVSFLLFFRKILKKVLTSYYLYDIINLLITDRGEHHGIGKRIFAEVQYE